MTVRALLASKEIRTKDLAKLFRFTPQAASRKLSRNYFTLRELMLIKDTYGLTPEDIVRIFFWGGIWKGRDTGITISTGICQ